MATFVGWAPTIVGRVAFSRVGSDLSQHPEICNHASRSDGFIFGKEVRTSPDGPIPASLLRLLGRRPDQQFAIFLEVQPAKLPRPLEDGPDAVELVEDERGMLAGDLYFFSKSKLSKDCKIDEVLDLIGASARKARSPRTDEARRLELFKESQQAAAALFVRLEQACRTGGKTPAFAKARIELDRTGRCQVDLDRLGLFVNRATKLAHLTSEDSPQWKAAIPAFEKAAHFISRHAYNVIRDLSHKHYHHHRHADLLATTYPWSLSNDQEWRRETLYGLTRMAIDIRRRGTAKAFKQCAGVVSYAEAFQLHLGTWSLAPTGGIGSAPTVPPYDFAALRTSIDASLKVKELEDAERRQTILYLTTIVLAALAVVVPGVRGLSPQPTGAFALSLSWVTHHPFLSVSMAALVAWFLDLAFLRAALPPWGARNFYYGLKRAAAAVMGSLIWRGLPSWLSFIITLGMLILVVTISAVVTGFALYLAYANLGGR